MSSLFLPCNAPDFVNQDYKTYHSQLDKIVSLMHAKPHLVTYKARYGSTSKKEELMGLIGESLGDITAHLTI